MALLTSYWGLDGIVIFVSLLIGFYVYMTRNFKYWEKLGITELPPTPFIGNFANCLLLKKSPSMFLMELYRKSKGLPYVGFYVFDKPCILIRDPEILKHVLVKDFDVFNDRYTRPNKFDRLGYANMFMIQNPAWKMLRSKITPFFTNFSLKKQFELMLFVAEDLDAKLEKDIAGGSAVIEVKDLCASYTTDVVASIGFGIQANALREGKAELREISKMIFNPSIFRGLELLIIFFLPHLTDITRAKFFGKEANTYFRSAIWPMVKERMRTDEDRQDLVKFLLGLRKKYNDDPSSKGLFSFDGDDLLAQIIGFFTAGFETSSTLMSFCLYEIALHMDVQTRLRKEIQDALEETEGKITFEMVMNLPYLHMVASETLRKYPSLGFVDRVPNVDYKIPNTDVVLKKGTPVYVPLYAIQHDEQHFPDPEKFDPERFNETNRQNISPCTYIPFGDGPRICVGMKLGLLQAKLGLLKLLSKYEVTTCEKTTIPMVLNPKSLVLSSLDGIHLNIRRSK